MKMKLISLACFCTLTACTYNISMAHTEGTATDVIDDTQSNTPDIKPTLTIPMPMMSA
jgi:hypothetical protein